MSIPIPLACFDCRGAPVFSIDPGSDGEVAENVITLLLARPVTTKGWCLACCIKRGWLTAECDRQATNGAA